MRKKVLVAGFFDLFHSGHVKFFENCSTYGDVYVSIGTDENSIFIKNKKPIYIEDERLYLVNSCKFVTEAKLSYNNMGKCSFKDYLQELKPDYFIINEDSHTVEKKKICEEHNVEYIILKREPRDGLPARSSTLIRDIDSIPLRLDLVGFYDQLFFNSVVPGSVILANIQPFEVEDRSGMSSSTRKVIHKVFGRRLPTNMDSRELARCIFAIENPPGSKYISGVVDQLGICLPGINKLYFDNDYWPNKIDSITEPSILRWLSDCLYLKPTIPRPENYKVITGKENFDKSLIEQQSRLGEQIWEDIKNKDLLSLGHHVTEVHNVQQSIIPDYESNYIKPIIEDINKKHLGCKIMGAGGYGYIMVVTDSPASDLIPISINEK